MCINNGKKIPDLRFQARLKTVRQENVSKSFISLHILENMLKVQIDRSSAALARYIYKRDEALQGGEQKDSEKKRQRRGTIDKRIDTAKDKFWKIC